MRVLVLLHSCIVYQHKGKTKLHCRNRQAGNIMDDDDDDDDEDDDDDDILKRF